MVWGKKEKLVEESREGRMNEQSDYGDTQEAAKILYIQCILYIQNIPVMPIG